MKEESNIQSSVLKNLMNKDKIENVGFLRLVTLNNKVLLIGSK